MGNSSRESADAFHPLGTKKMCFKFFSLGNIRVNNQKRSRIIFPVPDETPTTLHQDLFSFLCKLLHFTLPIPFAQRLLTGLAFFGGIRTVKQRGIPSAGQSIRTPAIKLLG